MAASLKGPFLFYIKCLAKDDVLSKPVELLDGNRH